MPELAISGTTGVRILPFKCGASLCEILAATDLRLPTACGGIGACGLCRIYITDGKVNSLTAGELNVVSENELSEGIRLACQVRPCADVQIEVGIRPSPLTWRSLSDDEFNHVIFPGHPGDVSIQSQHQYGVAVDLGTTQIRVSVWERNKKVRIYGCSALNPQATLGADVLTRLAAATDSEKHARILGFLVKNAIGEALSYIAGKTGLNLKKIGQVVVVGNTTMLCLLAEKNYRLLLQPEYWTGEIDYRPENTSEWNLAWGIDPNACVEIIPPLAGFVGSDFLAATIATKFTEGDSPALLLDFGTNSEIGLWDGSTLWVTSAACGPAFECSGISCGMPAEPGAIYKVERTDSSAGFQCGVIGGIEAHGLCGSGLTDVIAILIQEGLLNRKGMFTSEVGAEGIRISNGQKNITMNKRDVDTFQRAKAAISAGIVCLLEKCGIQPVNLQRVCVCGAFGQFLNITHAQEIGLLPGVPAHRIELHGNAALAGAEFLLFSHETSDILISLRAKTRIENMVHAPSFEERFIEGLFIQPMQMEFINRED